VPASGLVMASSLLSRTALRDPTAVGANTIVTEQFAPAASVTLLSPSNNTSDIENLSVALSMTYLAGTAGAEGGSNLAGSIGELALHLRDLRLHTVCRRDADYGKWYLYSVHVTMLAADTERSRNEEHDVVPLTGRDVLKYLDILHGLSGGLLRSRGLGRCSLLTFCDKGPTERP